ncbi:hypothetical protein TNIN_91361 [Trichonephila inaurata madagascariensis]|uniref:Uncharacterized protein n=1 Tax=Trichonephila inaurata madagascariensis TaxID=2747483 RepID=A0A8X6WVH1_9ARAC|nr:hypothetical protein TNIN_91361 [Trichonephila inaurata madagascariensis]
MSSPSPRLHTVWRGGGRLDTSFHPRIYARGQSRSVVTEGGLLMLLQLRLTFPRKTYLPRVERISPGVCMVREPFLVAPRGVDGMVLEVFVVSCRRRDWKRRE